MLGLIILLTFSAGCGKPKQQPIASESDKVTYQGYSAYAHHGESSADAQYVRFRKADGVEQFYITLPRELPRLVVQYEAQLKAGKLTFKVLNHEGKALIGGKTDANGHLKLYHSLRVPSGKYVVQTEYDGAENGDIHYTIYGYYK